MIRGGASGGGPNSNRSFGQDASVWVPLIGLLKKKELLPVVIFTFSKKRCEENASRLTNTDLTNSVEKSEIHVMLERSLGRLKGAWRLPEFVSTDYSHFEIFEGSDKNLPQITNMKELLSRGIGVHHGGLLPIVKEVRYLAKLGYFR